MANLNEWQRDYLDKAVRGYVNGYADCGPDDYPPITRKELLDYGWETIAYERDVDPTARAIYFAGKKQAYAYMEQVINGLHEWEAGCVSDWQDKR